MLSRALQGAFGQGIAVYSVLRNTLSSLSLSAMAPPFVVTDNDIGTHLLLQVLALGVWNGQDCDCIIAAVGQVVPGRWVVACGCLIFVVGTLHIANFHSGCSTYLCLCFFFVGRKCLN